MSKVRSVTAGRFGFEFVLVTILQFVPLCTPGVSNENVLVQARAGTERKGV